MTWIYVCMMSQACERSRARQYNKLCALPVTDGGVADLAVGDCHLVDLCLFPPPPALSSPVINGGVADLAVGDCL